MAPLVFQLSGTCNNYPWGKKGKQSLAAQLCAKTPGLDFKIEDDEFYSEMWFGDYPDFPARVLDSGELLKDVLDGNKEQLLGKKVIEKYDAQLPYLPKVILASRRVCVDQQRTELIPTQILSIAKALPLQIHPNKDLATKLHKKDPDNFTDPNHKPEIAVALSKFEVFAGFKPLSEIEPLFKLQPLRQFVPGSEGSSWSEETLRSVTRSLLKADLPDVKQVQGELAHLSRQELGEAAYILDLLPRLQDQYGPEDAGSLVALLCMNYMVFDAGDAIYIPADGIHAYLSGDIVECMARSNNVLNAGFCPPADRNNVDMFADTLTFKAHSKGDVYLPSQKSERSKEGRTVAYKPPMSEFDMLKTDLGAGESDVIAAGDGPGVMIVTSGTGLMKADGKDYELKEGFIFYIAPDVSVSWETNSGVQIHMAVV
jgi:mannose-6-phosphate isomerase